MDNTATMTVYSSEGTLTFTVIRVAATLEHLHDYRITWAYTVLDSAHKVLAHGTDLGSPYHTTAEESVMNLVGFACAAGDPHSGAGDLGFPPAAIEAFAAFNDELAIASIDETIG